MLRISREWRIVLLRGEEHEPTRHSAEHKDEVGETTVPDDSIQQRMQRLAASQQQCVDRVAELLPK